MLRRRLLTLCVLGAVLVVPQAAAAAPATPPVVTSVTPLRATVGAYLTIRGRNFVPGRMRNTVAFQRVRARAVFVPADFATSRYMRVRISPKLLPFLVIRADIPRYTRFRIRVLSRRFALYFTPMLRSPLIGPSRLASAGGLAGAVGDWDEPPASSEAGDCPACGLPLMLTIEMRAVTPKRLPDGQGGGAGAGAPSVPGAAWARRGWLSAEGGARTPPIVPP